MKAPYRLLKDCLDDDEELLSLLFVGQSVCKGIVVLRLKDKFMLPASSS